MCDWFVACVTMSQGLIQELMDWPVMMTGMMAWQVHTTNIPVIIVVNIMTVIITLNHQAVFKNSHLSFPQLWNQVLKFVCCMVKIQYIYMLFITMRKTRFKC